MRAKWRKIIWAILALQLLMLHLLFLLKNYRLDNLVNKAVRHFNLPLDLYFRWKQLAVMLWLVTAALILIFHYTNYRRFRRYCIRQLDPVTEEAVRQSLRQAVQETGLHKSRSDKRQRTFLYRSREITEPFVIGFWKPVLLLPDREYGENVLKFIFLHECQHIRHWDTVYKLFMLLLQALLWFQPLMYLLRALGSRDVEVACDEAVVKGRNMEERKEYGYALLECMKQEKARKEVYSAYFYHGKKLMQARITAIMKEDRKWDFLAYIGICILLLELGFNAWRVAADLYTRYRPEPEAPLIYAGYEIPESFTATVSERMLALEPVSADVYYEQFRAGSHEIKEFADLPYAAEGPWQVRLQDTDRYAEALRPLLQRYLYYYIDWEWASQWDAENNKMAGGVSIEYNRLLAGDKQEAVFAVIFRYFVGNESDLEQFPAELSDLAQFTCENGAYYAYFDWAVHICMVKDYVFSLEGVADTATILKAFREQYAQADFQDVPGMDLAYKIVPGTREDAAVRDSGNSRPVDGEMQMTENPFQIDQSTGVLKVSGRDCVLREVPVPLEELLYRGDQMDGQLTSLQEGSYQVNENKQIFAYGGSPTIPISVVYYDEERQNFEKSIVTRSYFGGRRIFVWFPENSQEGFLIFTGERVVWQESTILFRTVDGGKSWQEVGEAGTDVFAQGHSLTTDAVFINNQVGFLTIRDSKTPNIWRTQDGGETWEKQALPQAPQSYSMAYGPEERDGILCLYVGMEDYSEYGGTKAKYESTDEGATWTYKGLVLRK